MIPELERLKVQLLQLEGCTEAELVGRINGLHWAGYSMIGLRRLDNLEYCIDKVIDDKILGCIVEAGVWRGGAMIFAAAVLRIRMEWANRRIYVCDIFDGTFPESNNAMDKWTTEYDFSQLSVSLEDVQENFSVFGQLSPNVIFKKGWFSNTLPTIKESVAVLRIDGDTYQSTMDSLILEPQIPSGGFIIMDDWAIESSKKAFLDYFDGKVTEKDVIPVDSLSVYWRKP